MRAKESLENILKSINELKEWAENELKGLKEYKPKRWKPKDHEKYYFFDNYYGVENHYWINDLTDNYLHTTHNCFKTKEEAEAYGCNLETKRLLMVFADEHNEDIDWKDYNQFKYSIYYNYEYDKLNVMSTDSIRKKDIYFSSEEIAEQAIEEIGEERIKKYLLEE